MLRLALALAALLALPATATALTGTEAGMYVGETVWGMPACGQPHVEVTTPAQYAAEHGAANFADGATPLAWADENRCVIVINRDLAHREIRTPVKRCHVIVHEWGHLTGHDHSENQHSVMYGEDLVAESRVLYTKRRWRWQAAGAFKPCYMMASKNASVG